MLGFLIDGNPGIIVSIRRRGSSAVRSHYQRFAPAGTDSPGLSETPFAPADTAVTTFTRAAAPPMSEVGQVLSDGQARGSGHPTAHAAWRVFAGRIPAIETGFPTDDGETLFTALKVMPG